MDTSSQGLDGKISKDSLSYAQMVLIRYFTFLLYSILIKNGHSESVVDVNL